MPDHTPTPDGFKHCSKCQIMKPETTEFFRFHKKRQQYYAECRECENKSYRDRRINDPDGEKARASQWRAANREKTREYGRAYYRKNHIGWKAAQLKWRLAHPERAKASDKTRSQKYRANNPDVFRAKDARYQAIKQDLPSSYSSDDWQYCLEYFNHRCAICGRPVGLWHTLAQDHWIPLASANCPGTVPINIVPLCHGIDGCNNSKGHKDAVEWLTWKFGKRKASVILQRIKEYFACLK